MTNDQAAILVILAATMGMFVWGRWRHDMVAIAALLACVVAGLVPPPEAFGGFAHPAVVTVACVLILSHGLQTSGAVDVLTGTLLPRSGGPTVMIGALTALAAVLSAFMNNVGALALLMPVAIQVASREGIPPGRILMPVAFGSILGGMTTLIGTPPNLIVSGFRAGAGEGSFGMFDFTPVGAAVAVAGVAFIVLGGWRLVPTRARTDTDTFETGAYLTEVRVPEDSKTAGMRLHAIEALLEQGEAQIVGLIRNEVRISAPHPQREIRAGDVLLIEAEPRALASVLSDLGVRLEEAVRKEEEEEEEAEENGKAADSTDGRAEAPVAAAPDESAADESAPEAVPEEETAKDEEPSPASDEIVLGELVVLPSSHLAGRSARDIGLRSRYGVNLLAISRQGQRSVTRLRTTPLRQGDVLLMQGPPESLSAFSTQFGCVPLAGRALRLPDRRQAAIAAGIMVLAVAGAAFGLLPAAISFAFGVLAAMALRVVPPSGVYDAVDWPVIVLLGALIPVAAAMETSGAADLVARLLIDGVAQGHAVIALALILVVTMTLSDFMNNAATAAVMCPIAIGTAAQLQVDGDAFLMAVAVGASCAFLTPIGHQNNTLILGPGGFRFGDYWRLGLPVEILVVAVGVPAILLFWPL